MPRIRKRTSKRGTTARRAKIKHKVVESRRKSKKAAKKDLTWKSKKPKDPGIPNNLPFKDQILEEIAEERRQAAEAKARRKEEKRSLRAEQKAALNATGKDARDDSEEGDFDGNAMFGGPTKSPSKLNGTPAVASGTASTAGARGAPLLLNPDLPHLAAVLDKADVVIELLDARDPLSHRSNALEARVASKEGQKLLLVLNKIDACPREPTAAWAAHLRSEHPTLLFRVASSFLPPAVTHDLTKGKGTSKERLDDAWGLDAVSELLGHWAQEKMGDGPLHVAVVGLTNSGKSAFINSLARKATLDVYASSSSTNNPTTTPHALEIALELNGKPIVFIDTPGLVWQPSEEASPEERVRRRAQDVLLRNKGRVDRLKDPMPAVSYIVSRAEIEDLMVFYSLPAFAKGDVNAFLMGVARAHGLIKKGGKTDLGTAARLVLRDWSTGKLSRYAVPPAISVPGTAADALSPPLSTIYAGDVSLLERLPPRKELRRTRDLVRLSSERVDDRALGLEVPWFSADATDGESDSDVEDEGWEGIGSGEDEEATDEAESTESAESDGLGRSGSISEEDDNDDNSDSNDENVDADEKDEDKVSPTARSASAQKRKRPPSPPPSSLPKPSKRQSDAARPSKRVTFATSVVAITTRSPSSKGQQPPSIKTTSNPLARHPAIVPNDTRRKNILARSQAAATPSFNKTSANVPVGTSPRTRKPAANAPTTATAQRRKQVAGVGGDAAYDFTKFF
ncbi:hypothetical protein BJV74DRAFT_561280 [Russula compacta]|nr:hypothetical protein BJV74DRAFT_561280 [Russula compacta]